MGKLIGLIVILIVLAGLGLVAFAYVGPILGFDFSAPQTEIRVPVTLNPSDGS
ncbi:hypothetical protein SAMN05444000_106183 [Shimia gijangensis]|uniref:Uncharacterized protein n=1 Tax=Shimia gijangensis TaxID=1470563 RepID=A0A1M6HXJ8_9RHOB|nr:hypothetical protein [Shimia gijangensis]SHJ26797.1 hypothetical protein SAMN05444000_106183 [Shimia gijangensis]